MLPAGYQMLDYLESTGEQYIDTGVKIDGTSGVFCIFEPVGNTPNGWAVSAGTCKYNVTFAPLTRYRDNVGFQYKYMGGYPRKDGTWVTSGSQAGNLGYKVKEKCHVALNWLNDHQWVLEFNTERIVYSGLPNMSGSIDKLYLFARMYEGGVANHEAVRIYKMQISQGGQQTNTFIPAIDPTGAPCMYDIVTRKPFYNKGTGDFIYPKRSVTYSLRRVLPDWGKLTEHGLRRLYHTPLWYKGELYDYALENGYKPIVESEKPEEGYWTPKWVESSDEIVLEWIETEEPTEV